MKRIIAALVLIGTISLHAQAPTKAQLDALIDKLKADVDALFVTASTATVVTTNLQAAINSAIPGATLAWSYNETAAITIPKTLTLKGTGGAALRGGVTITGANVTIDGAAISAPASARQDVVILQGDNTKLLNVVITADPAGQKRGIMGNARGFYFSKVSVTGFQLAGQDSQAFACWDNCQDFLIEDSVFSGAGETFLVGGADHPTQSRMPKNGTVRRSTLTKDIAWRHVGPQVKNTLELKCIDGFTIEDSVIENSWQDAQDGYLIVLSPRNQDGANPWCGVSNVTIQRNRGGHAAALMQVFGADDAHPSQSLSNVKVIDNNNPGFVDIAPSIWRASSAWGSSFMILIGRSPVSFTFDRNSVAGGPPLNPFDGKQTGSVVYFDGNQKCGLCNVNGNHWPTSQYGVFGADVAPGQAWVAYVTAGTLSGNIEQ